MNDCNYCSQDDSKCIRDKCETCCSCGRRLNQDGETMNDKPSKEAIEFVERYWHDVPFNTNQDAAALALDAFAAKRMKEAYLDAADLAERHSITPIIVSNLRIKAGVK